MGEERGKVRCDGLNTRCARAHDADSRRAIVSGVFWGAVGTRAPLRARVQFQKVTAAMFYCNTVKNSNILFFQKFACACKKIFTTWRPMLGYVENGLSRTSTLATTL